MQNINIFQKYKLGNTELNNKIVMAPMTRSRAIGNLANELIAEYYTQRATAGLIITEGISPSPNGLGYSRIPGLFSKEQAESWKKVTNSVHAKGGRIFVQLMHTGRIAHQSNLPEGANVFAPSAVKAAGQIWTDANGMADHSEPIAFSAEQLEQTKQEYVNSAKLAMEAGFDGVELHGANGYLLEQFLSPFSNLRTDNYGGSIENRTRFVLEVVQAVADAIGKDRTAIRLSPYGVASDMPHYPEIDATYEYLAKELNKIGIVYIHLVDHSSMGAPTVPDQIKQTFRNLFSNTLILSGGFSRETAESVLAGGKADLVAFGRPFIGNPDLVERLRNNFEINTNLDFNTFYTPGEKGYTDYPFYSKQ